MNDVIQTVSSFFRYGGPRRALVALSSGSRAFVFWYHLEKYFKLHRVDVPLAKPRLVLGDYEARKVLRDSAELCPVSYLKVLDASGRGECLLGHNCVGKFEPCTMAITDDVAYVERLSTWAERVLLFRFQEPNREQVIEAESRVTGLLSQHCRECGKSHNDGPAYGHGCKECVDSGRFARGSRTRRGAVHMGIDIGYEMPTQEPDGDEPTIVEKR